jgi:hypothetical protein
MDEAVSRKRLGRVSFSFSVFCFFRWRSAFGKGTAGDKPRHGPKRPAAYRIPGGAAELRAERNGRAGQGDPGRAKSKRWMCGVAVSQSHNHIFSLAKQITTLAF